MYEFKCDVCGKKFEHHDPKRRSCDICQQLIKRYKKDKYSRPQVVNSLNKSYYTENDGLYFKCGYTGIISKFNESKRTLGCFKDAFVLTLDHEDPEKDDLVVSLNIINIMKCDIPTEKFKEIVIALWDFFKEEKDGRVPDSQKLDDTLIKICGNSH